MAQRNDDGVLPNSVIPRENSIQSSISTISLQVEENVKQNSTRTNSIPSIVSTISNEVEEEVRIKSSVGSIKRKIENKVHPISIPSSIVFNETEEGRIKATQ